MRKIEEDILFKDWRGMIDGREIKIGILSREAVLKDYIRSNDEIWSSNFWRWFSVDNIKHKLSIRSIEGIGILGFWMGAYAVTPAKIKVPVIDFAAEYLILIGFAFCVFWAVRAIGSPKRDLEREEKALAALNDGSPSGKG